jgi:hypothetical protein
MTKTTKTKWTPEDRQRFADGDVLKSRKHENRKRIANKRACRGRVEV